MSSEPRPCMWKNVRTFVHTIGSDASERRKNLVIDKVVNVELTKSRPLMVEVRLYNTVFVPIFEHLVHDAVLRSQVDMRRHG